MLVCGGEFRNESIEKLSVVGDAAAGPDDDASPVEGCKRGEPVATLI